MTSGPNSVSYAHHGILSPGNTTQECPTADLLRRSLSPSRNDILQTPFFIPYPSTDSNENLMYIEIKMVAKFQKAVKEILFS